MIHIGRWELSLKSRTGWRFGLGIEVALRSWRNAYPWLQLNCLVGPFFVGIEAVRPDDIALAMREDDPL